MARKSTSRQDSVEAIGNRLQLIRLAYNALHAPTREISQAEFARSCEINPPAWNNFETGDNRIGIDSAIKVARKTGASLDFIYLDGRSGMPHALAIEIEKLERAKIARRA